MTHEELVRGVRDMIAATRDYRQQGGTLDNETLDDVFATMGNLADRLETLYVELARTRAELAQASEQCGAVHNRRERIATAALTGLLGDPNRNGTSEAFAGFAVEAADALIAELLDKPQGEVATNG